MKQLKVQPIRNGTVIDHIPPGNALRVLDVLGLPRPKGTSIVSVAMNVDTDRKPAKRKDIVKIEDRELGQRELDKIALIAPDATINIIREYDVADKSPLQLPDTIQGVVDCANPNCVTNHEPGAPRFQVVRSDPPTLECEYCGREMEDVGAQVA